jgi:hypothetical protein
MVVETTLTDREACEACSRIPRDPKSDFPQQLVSQYRKFGNLFPNKLAWLHKLAISQIKSECEDLAGEQDPEFVPEAKNSINTPVANYSTLVNFLNPASESFKSGATVTIQVGDLTVQVKRAGQRSRFPGSFWVTNAGPYGNSVVYGRIGTNGDYFTARINEEVKAVLAGMNEDPVGYISSYGARTGRCAFCSLPLTDEVSMGMGYGKRCSENYRLPYGKMVLREIQCRRGVPAGV